ncbi:Hypothetical protein PHPALM_20133 [Phytophthora palmivora]|uniref:Uncharacterized protein n=1 Tax=Phytophthora palmivora TaxID=4796 RepID=A0A2P4XFM0_9STRA|nr:Hypothetical protein PHPALM_20133 [Phytophthora palmivora]
MVRRPHSAGGASSRRAITSREHHSPIDNGPHSADDLNRDNDQTDEKRTVLNELRRRQNEELLKVLEEEHHAEEQREHLLRQASADRRERVRMEQLFDKERALTSERIMQLTDRHERALAAKMDELQVT